MTGFALAFARAAGEYGSVVFIAGNMPMKTEIVPLLILTKLEQYDSRSVGPFRIWKTTLLRVIAGLDYPDSGSILFDGQDATRVPIRKRKVGFVFQHYALFRHMTVFRQDEALEIADRVVIMNNGRIEQIGTPLEVSEEPATAFVCEFLQGRVMA